MCFAIFSILISAPLFATGVSSTASSADCDNSTLNTYTGTSNLQADWTANTIALHWYNDDTELTVPSASQSCVYDGTLTPPATIPTKTGYTFKGWRVRQASASCFANSVCGLTGSAVDGLAYSGYGYYSHDGQDTYNTDTYGLSAGKWAVEFTNGGIVKGIASCNSTAATYGEWDSCDSDAIQPSNTFSNSVSGQYCWCKMESWTPSGGSACNVASPSWVFGDDLGSASDCAGICADYCANAVVDSPGFRRAVFGVAGN